MIDVFAIDMLESKSFIMLTRMVYLRKVCVLNILVTTVIGTGASVITTALMSQTVSLVSAPLVNVILMTKTLMSTNVRSVANFTIERA